MDAEPRRLDVMDSKAQAQRLAAKLRRRIRLGDTPYSDAWAGHTLPNGWTTIWVTDRPILSNPDRRTPA